MNSVGYTTTTQDNATAKKIELDTNPILKTSRSTLKKIKTSYFSKECHTPFWRICVWMKCMKYAKPKIFHSVACAKIYYFNTNNIQLEGLSLITVQAAHKVFGDHTRRSIELRTLIPKSDTQAGWRSACKHEEPITPAGDCTALHGPSMGGAGWYNIVLLRRPQRVLAIRG